jgi:hypothetical protein
MGRSCDLVNHNGDRTHFIATRLAQANKREAKSMTILSAPAPPQPENVCLGCGKPVAKASTRCATCAVEVSKRKMIEVARQGRIASKSPKARARVAATQRRQQKARWSWQSSSQPDWLTEKTYETQIKPLLIQNSISKIATTLNVSVPYAANIRLGKRRPHPRHWHLLARLIGVTS